MAQFVPSTARVSLSLRRTIAALAACTFLSLHTLTAQIPDDAVRGFDMKSRDITIEPVEPPSLGDVGDDLIENNEWAAIEVIIEAQPEDLDDRIEADYMKNLEVKISWLTPLPDERDLDYRERQVFSLTQTFEQVKPADEVAFVGYIPPSWVERFGGASRIEPESNVGVQVFYNGVLVLEGEMRDSGRRAGDDPDWFRNEGQKGAIFPITESPWMTSGWDRYSRPTGSEE